MATLKWNRKKLLCKIEGTYGTDSLPTGPDLITTRNAAITPYAGDVATWDYDRDELGAQEQVNVAPSSDLSFEVGLQGANGNVDDLAQFDALMRACGFSQTVDAGVDVTYAPVQTGFESVSMKYYHDDQLHTLLGARGDWNLQFSRGTDLPRIGFDMKGFYARPTNPVAVVATRAELPPLPVNFTNTATVEIFGFVGARLESLTLNGGNQVIHRNLPNGNEVFINDREMTGQLVVEAPDLATKDFFANVESHQGVSLGALKVVHGTEVGKIVEVGSTAMQLSSIAMSDSDGLTVYTIDFRLIGSDFELITR